jgi:hypothetical protein
MTAKRREIQMRIKRAENMSDNKQEYRQHGMLHANANEKWSNCSSVQALVTAT